MKQKLMGLAVASALTFSLSACSQSGEVSGVEWIEKGYEATSKLTQTGVCQGKVLARSGLAAHWVDRILAAGDPASAAKDFGYKKLGKKLKNCSKIVEQEFEDSERKKKAR